MLLQQTETGVATLGGKSRRLFLPPYSLGRNLAALVGKHLKLDAAGRIAVTGNDGVQRKVRASMRDLQNDARKIRSFDQKPARKYAA